jgi:hypothetical protein
MTSIQLEEDLLEGLEQFIRNRNEPPGGRMTCDEAVNVIIRDWLMGQGYISLPDDEDYITPALEAAKVPKS